MELIRSADIFHIASLSWTAKPARQGTMAVISAAKEARTVIFYDPNYRPLLWNSRRLPWNKSAYCCPV